MSWMQRNLIECNGNPPYVDSTQTGPVKACTTEANLKTLHDRIMVHGILTTAAPLTILLKNTSLTDAATVMFIFILFAKRFK